MRRCEFAGVIGGATACAIFFGYGVIVTATVAVLLVGRPVRAQQPDLTQPDVTLICASTNRHLPSNKAVHVEIFFLDQSILIRDGIFDAMDMYPIIPPYDRRQMIDRIIESYLHREDDYKCSVSGRK